MKVGDFVMLVYKFGKPRVGIVTSMALSDKLVRVYWENGDQTWLVENQLRRVKDESR